MTDECTCPKCDEPTAKDFQMLSRDFERPSRAYPPDIARIIALALREAAERRKPVVNWLETEDRRERKLATIVAPDNGTPHEILSAVLECAKAWVPEARIIGNVRAGDIARAIEATPAPDREAAIEAMSKAVHQECIRLVGDLGYGAATLSPANHNLMRAALDTHEAHRREREPVKIKPLDWSEPSPPNGDCSYDHVTADSALGHWSIEWKSWKDYPGFVTYLNGEYLTCANKLDEAKAAAQADYEARIRSVLVDGGSNG